MLTRTRTRRGGQREDGAAALMMAITVTLLCVVAAFAIDLGLLRYTKADNQAAADIAAAAGIRGVAAADGMPRPYQGVCDALEVLTKNRPDLSSLSPDWTNMCKEGSSSLGLLCEPNNPATFARYKGSNTGGTTVRVESGYRLGDDPEFANVDTGGTDTGSAIQGGCDQLAVVIRQPQGPIFAGFAGQKDPITTMVRTVARVDTGANSVAAVALLLLEQSGCLALEANGTGTKVIVYGAQGRPGIIHADSRGDASDCSSSNAVIDGGSADSIIAKAAEIGNPPSPGKISTFGLLQNPATTTAYDSTANILSEPATSPRRAPTGHALVGRAPFDRFYAQAVGRAVATATGEWGPPPPGYTVVTGCNNPRPTDPAAPKVFINCPGGATYDSTSLPDFTGDTWVFNGPVKITGSLRLPNATQVYIKGSTTAGLFSSGTFHMNGGGYSCGTLTRPRARLVIGSGPFVAEGKSLLRMCQTTMILASQNNATDCPIGGFDDDVPRSNSCNGFLSVTGQTSVDWTAPDLVGTERTRADLDQLEDLALWGEASGFSGNGNYNRLEGQGALSLSGVFFTPNANPFRVAGNGTLDNPYNAQFATRRLQAAGGGILHMKPDPHDIVSVPYFGDSMLVR